MRKFHSVAGEHKFRLHLGSIVKAVGHLEKISVRELATRSVPAVTKDGERIPIEFTINLLRGRDGKILGPVAVVRDVTARWYRERLMRQKIAFLEAGQATM